MLNTSSSRCYHQSQVKNGVLFIDGGIASFSDRAPYSNVCTPHRSIMLDPVVSIIDIILLSLKLTMED